MTTTSSAAVPVHRFAHGGDGDRRRALWPAVALAVFEVVGTIGASQGQPEARDLDALAFLLVLAAPVALIWRRTRPQVALGVAFASALVYLALDYPKGPIFIGLVAGVRQRGGDGVAPAGRGHPASPATWSWRG